MRRRSPCQSQKKREKASRINEGWGGEVNFDLLLCISVQLSCNGNVMLREQRQKSTLSHRNLCSPLLMVWNRQYAWPAVQHHSCFSSLHVDETTPGCGSFLGLISYNGVFYSVNEFSCPSCTQRHFNRNSIVSTTELPDKNENVPSRLWVFFCSRRPLQPYFVPFIPTTTIQ